MIPRLDHSDSIIVPISKPADLDQVGSVAYTFATTLKRRIDVVTIIHPDDDYAAECERFTRAIQDFSHDVAMPVSLQVLADANTQQALLDFCDDRLVCMKTSATPFDADHYVGSHAATLLAESAAPVILIGPRATNTTAATVVVAVSEDSETAPALQAGGLLGNAVDSGLTKLRIAGNGVIYETHYDSASTGLPDTARARVGTGPLSDDQLCQTLADRSRNAILVMPTRAKRGLAWICDGSVAFSTIQRASGPIVALGPNANLTAGATEMDNAVVAQD